MSSYALAVPCNNIQLQVNNTNADTTFTPAVNVALVVKSDTSDGGCDFYLTFDNGGASTYNLRQMKNGFDEWPYQVSKDSNATNILKAGSEVTSINDVLTGVMPGYSGNDKQVPLSFWVVRDQTNPWRKSGNYTNNFNVTLYKGTFPNGTFVTSRQVSTNNNAQKRVDLSIVPPGGVFNLADNTETLDFGLLTTGATKSADIIIKTNNGYRLYASSANNGRMKHLTQNEYIAYTAVFNSNITMNLSNSASNPQQVLSSTGNVTSPASGFVVPVKITIGNTTGAKAGNYSDIITLTVQAH